VVCWVFIYTWLLDFDNDRIVHSAVWCAGIISLLLLDNLDFISTVGIVGAVINEILDLTLFIQDLLWIGLALVGLALVGIVATN
jgi:hypothetical protein